VLLFSLSLLVACDGSEDSGTGPGASDAAADTGADAGAAAGADASFTAAPIDPIVGYAHSEFQADDVPFELTHGLLKTLEPGDEGIEGRTFPEASYLLVLADVPIGCEQEIDTWHSEQRVTMYFNLTHPLPAVGLYPEVAWVDRHPEQRNRFSVKASSGGISGTLSEVAEGVASGTVKSDGAARTYFSGNFEAVVCPD
jgi:hypothetical protein